MPLAAMLAGVLALEGCAAGPAPVPSHDELIGTWRDQAGPVLVLRGDGTFRGDGLTSGLSTATGPCTWQVGQRDGPVRAPDGCPWVDLDFRSAAYSQVRCALFEIDDRGSTTTLLQKIHGDDDNRYDLSRPDSRAESGNQ